MQFGPRFDQTSLPPRQRASNQIDWVERKNCHLILVIRMKVGQVMRLTRFHVHADNDAEKAAQFWHQLIVFRPAAARRRRINVGDLAGFSPLLTIRRLLARPIPNALATAERTPALALSTSAASFSSRCWFDRRLSLRHVPGRHSQVVMAKELVLAAGSWAAARQCWHSRCIGHAVYGHARNVVSFHAL
jgi:hypothetical protein